MLKLFEEIHLRITIKPEFGANGGHAEKLSMILQAATHRFDSDGSAVYVGILKRGALLDLMMPKKRLAAVNSEKLSKKIKFHLEITVSVISKTY